MSWNKVEAFEFFLKWSLCPAFWLTVSILRRLPHVLNKDQFLFGLKKELFLYEFCGVTYPFGHWILWLLRILSLLVQRWGWKKPAKVGFKTKKTKVYVWQSSCDIGFCGIRLDYIRFMRWTSSCGVDPTYSMQNAWIWPHKNHSNKYLFFLPSFFFNFLFL